MTLNEHRQLFLTDLESLLAELRRTQTVSIGTLNKLEKDMSCVGIILQGRPNLNLSLRELLPLSFLQQLQELANNTTCSRHID